MGLVTLTFDRLTVKLVCESRLRWGSSLPNLGTLGLWVLKLFAMYATDGQTDRRTDRPTKATLRALLALTYMGGGITITTGPVDSRWPVDGQWMRSVANTRRGASSSVGCTGSVYARRRRPCSMFLAPNT